jgi:hypothetical protein
MRYTSDPMSTTNDRSLRDVERWKDKIEVRLDNRQVFFLFFGSALVACLLFILGVMVGKRLESRGKAVAPEIEDPLALLDKVAASPLAAAAEPPARARPAQPLPRPVPPLPPTKLIAPPAPAPALAEVPAAVAEAPAGKTAAPAAGKKTAKQEAEASRHAALAEAPTRTVVAEPASHASAEPRPAPRPTTTTTLPAAASVARLEVTDGPASKKVVPIVAPADSLKKGHFTLQLGSFPDQAEAEAFAKQFEGQPYVVPTEIPGRGLWYRVRVGDYPSAKDAIAAKATFEKQHNVIAYVVPPAAAK